MSWRSRLNCGAFRITAFRLPMNDEVMRGKRKRTSCQVVGCFDKLDPRSVDYCPTHRKAFLFGDSSFELKRERRMGV